MSIIQHRDNVITLPIVADDNECRPIFSNNQTLLRGNDELSTVYSTRSITFEWILPSDVWSIMGSVKFFVRFSINTYDIA